MCWVYSVYAGWQLRISKAHAYASNRKQQERLFWTPSHLGLKYHGVEGKTKNGFELVVFDQMQPHKIGLSDMRSPNSQIQLRYTRKMMPIKDGRMYHLKSAHMIVSKSMSNRKVDEITDYSPSNFNHSNTNSNSSQIQGPTLWRIYHGPP